MEKFSFFKKRRIYSIVGNEWYKALIGNSNLVSQKDDFGACLVNRAGFFN